MGKERVMGRGKSREWVAMHEFTFPEISTKDKQQATILNSLTGMGVDFHQQINVFQNFRKCIFSIVVSWMPYGNVQEW